MNEVYCIPEMGYYKSVTLFEKSFGVNVKVSCNSKNPDSPQIVLTKIGNHTLTGINTVLAYRALDEEKGVKSWGSNVGTHYEKCYSYEVDGNTRGFHTTSSLLSSTNNEDGTVTRKYRITLKYKFEVVRKTWLKNKKTGLTEREVEVKFDVGNESFPKEQIMEFECKCPQLTYVPEPPSSSSSSSSSEYLEYLGGECVEAGSSSSSSSDGIPGITRQLSTAPGCNVSYFVGSGVAEHPSQFPAGKVAGIRLTDSRIVAFDHNASTWGIYYEPASSEGTYSRLAMQVDNCRGSVRLDEMSYFDRSVVNIWSSW